ncbi:hypothetical protein LZ30DRAFT_477567 [Colletotrichum cereale]|nr:hypothetical protein LZ30DRAFT_477567 [Colletotrichum cereale]
MGTMGELLESGTCGSGPQSQPSDRHPTLESVKPTSLSRRTRAAKVRQVEPAQTESQWWVSHRFHTRPHVHYVTRRSRTVEKRGRVRPSHAHVSTARGMMDGCIWRVREIERLHAVLQTFGRDKCIPLSMKVGAVYPCFLSSARLPVCPSARLPVSPSLPFPEEGFGTETVVGCWLSGAWRCLLLHRPRRPADCPTPGLPRLDCVAGGVTLAVYTCCGCTHMRSLGHVWMPCVVCGRVRVAGW